MATDTVKSQSITFLDQIPIEQVPPGQGGIGRPVTVDDMCLTTATGLQSSGSTYRLVRIPTGAMIKSVEIASDVALDKIASAPTLALDFNLVFSDSTDDGTPVFLQGLIPMSGNSGTTTNFTTYSSPNLIFGNFKPTTLNGANTTALALTQLVFNGSRTNYPMSSLMQQPLFQLFGFVDGRGVPADPGGYFDLVAYVSTGAATGAVANVYAKVTYVI
jgi:hypothetical protein